ncbi:MAG: hypothetical protein PHG66_01420 [Candidatus Colwellbacteria bacterium]|nr:hypothetical protein [Candidatus Colwellbacteria bacterium]
MIVLITGGDSWRRKKQFKDIALRFKEKHGGSGLRFFDMSSEETSDLIGFIRGRSMFDPLSMAAVDGLNVGDMDKEDIASLGIALKKASSDREMTVLISMEEDPSSVFFLEKEDIFNSWNFEPLKGAELSALVLKEATLKGLKLSVSDVNSVISALSGDLWGIGNELDRLALSGGLVSSDRYAGLNYFAALNSFKFGNNPLARLAALELLLTKLKEDPARVFNGLAYSAPRDIPSETWSRTMADLDIAVKSGKMDYTEALVALATR